VIRGCGGARSANCHVADVAQLAGPGIRNQCEASISLTRGSPSLRAEAQDSARKSERDMALLTDREQAVLRCLADGQPNRLIARTLSITEGTVKVHVKHLLKKLNFRSRVEAAVWATQIGMRQS
jgi:two-component system nitrate/nitrite response regulator NarL